MTVTGKVIKGAGRSRLFGYPTANLGYSEVPDLEPGIYVGQATVSDQVFPCAICYTDTKLFEVHMFGLKQDLYDQEVKVEVGQKVSDFKKFDKVEELKQKIKQDIARVKEILCLPE